MYTFFFKGSNIHYKFPHKFYSWNKKMMSLIHNIFRMQ